MKNPNDKIEITRGEWDEYLEAIERYHQLALDDALARTGKYPLSSSYGIGRNEIIKASFPAYIEWVDDGKQEFHLWHQYKDGSVYLVPRSSCKLACCQAVTI